MNQQPGVEQDLELLADFVFYVAIVRMELFQFAGGKGTRLLTSAPTGDFTTTDAYAFTRELEKLHPDKAVRTMRLDLVREKTGPVHQPAKQNGKQGADAH